MISSNWTIWLVGTSAGCVLALISILAVWVAIGKRFHWFLRAALLLSVIALLLPADVWQFSTGLSPGRW